MYRSAAALVSLLLVVAGISCGERGPDVAGGPEESRATADPSPTPEPVVSPEPAEPTLSSAPAGAPDPVTEEDRLRLDGIGRLTVGMTIEEAEEATGRKIRIWDEFSEQCRQANLSGGPRDLVLMLSYGRVMLIEVWGKSKIKTVSGIAVGSSERDVERVYGSRITREPHPYGGDKGAYLVYTPINETDLLLIFETDGKKVTSFRSGYEEQVRYIEGCA